jgi:hypothetical protein
MTLKIMKNSERNGIHYKEGFDNFIKFGVKNLCIQCSDQLYTTNAESAMNDSRSTYQLVNQTPIYDVNKNRCEIGKSLTVNCPGITLNEENELFCEQANLEFQVEQIYKEEKDSNVLTYIFSSEMETELNQAGEFTKPGQIYQENWVNYNRAEMPRNVPNGWELDIPSPFGYVDSLTQIGSYSKECLSQSNCSSRAKNINLKKAPKNSLKNSYAMGCLYKPIETRSQTSIVGGIGNSQNSNFKDQNHSSNNKDLENAKLSKVQKKRNQTTIQANCINCEKFPIKNREDNLPLETYFCNWQGGFISPPSSSPDYSPNDTHDGDSKLHSLGSKYEMIAIDSIRIPEFNNTIEKDKSIRNPQTTPSSIEGVFPKENKKVKTDIIGESNTNKKQKFKIIKFSEIERKIEKPNEQLLTKKKTLRFKIDNPVKIKKSKPGQIMDNHLQTAFRNLVKFVIFITCEKEIFGKKLIRPKTTLKWDMEQYASSSIYYYFKDLCLGFDVGDIKKRSKVFQYFITKTPKELCFILLNPHVLEAHLKNIIDPSSKLPSISNFLSRKYQTGTKEGKNKVKKKKMGRLYTLLTNSKAKKRIFKI